MDNDNASVRKPDANASESPDTPCFTCSYLYENNLLSGLAYLQANGARKCILYLLGIGGLAGGAVRIALGGAWSWVGFPLIAAGLFLLWCGRNLYHIMARGYIDAMQSAEGDESRRRRVVEVDADNLVVTLPDGAAKRYRIAELSRIEQDRDMFVLMFGKDGVVIPRDSFIAGSVEQFERFLSTLPVRGAKN